MPSEMQFPPTVPPVEISPSPLRLEPIDCRELQWWFVIPELGQSWSVATYDLDTGALDSVRRVVSVEPAEVASTAVVSTDVALTDVAPGEDAGGEAVALTVRETGGRGETFRFLCRLEPDQARWLAVTVIEPDGSTTTTTEGDENFEWNWGVRNPRRLVDRGRYQLLTDGSYHLRDVDDRGAGVYTVRVGDNSFTCLRVMDVDEADEAQEIGDAFVEPGGRTVLYRQFRGRGLDADWEQWRRAHPGQELRIDGALFFQRDCLGRAHLQLTEAAFDASLATRA